MPLDSGAERALLTLAYKAIAMPLDATAEMPGIAWTGTLRGWWLFLHVHVQCHHPGCRRSAGG